jgi:hypothetical protein
MTIHEALTNCDILYVIAIKDGESMAMLIKQTHIKSDGVEEISEALLCQLDLETEEKSIPQVLNLFLNKAFDPEDNLSSKEVIEDELENQKN